MARNISLPGWLYPIPGLFVQTFGLFSGDVELSLWGTLILTLGLAVYARRKGYSHAWGLYGLAPFVGPAIILVQPDRRDAPAARMRGGIPLFSIMAVLGVAATLISPQVLDGTLFSRTPEPIPAPLPPVPDPPPAEPAPPPPPEPQPPAPAPEPPPEPAPPASFEEGYHRIKVGMTYEEVTDLVGDDNYVVGQSPSGLKVIRWEGPDREAFTTRFVNGKLDMLSNLQKRPRQVSASARRRLDELTEQRMRETAERMLGEAPPSEVTTQPPEEPDEVSPVLQEPIPEPEQPQEEDTGVVTGRGRREQVVRIGSQAGEERRRPSVRKARLPRFSGAIKRGPHDVVFVNRGENVLKVGVRSNMRGLDFEIQPEQYEVMFVSNGAYKVYYIDTGDPETLHDAGPIIVDTPPVALRMFLPR